MGNIRKGVCATCGAEFESRGTKAKFCSQYCANKYRVVRDKERTAACPHNAFVKCDDRRCASCGWNPAVAQERLRKFTGKECTA